MRVADRSISPIVLSALLLLTTAHAAQPAPMPLLTTPSEEVGSSGPDTSGTPLESFNVACGAWPDIPAVGCAHAEVDHTQPSCGGTGEDYSCSVGYALNLTLTGTGGCGVLATDQSSMSASMCSGGIGGLTRTGFGYVDYDVPPEGRTLAVVATVCYQPHGGSVPTCASWTTATIFLPPEGSA